MKYLGLALALMTASALLAAIVTMVRNPKTGTGQRGFWVVIVFFVPIIGPLVYLNRSRR